MNSLNTLQKQRTMQHKVDSSAYQHNYTMSQLFYGTFDGQVNDSNNMKILKENMNVNNMHQTSNKGKAVSKVRESQINIKV